MHDFVTNSGDTSSARVKESNSKSSKTATETQGSGLVTGELKSTLKNLQKYLKKSGPDLSGQAVSQISSKLGELIKVAQAETALNADSTSKACRTELSKSSDNLTQLKRTKTSEDSAVLGNQCQSSQASSHGHKTKMFSDKQVSKDIHKDPLSQAGKVVHNDKGKVPFKVQDISDRKHQNLSKSSKSKDISDEPEAKRKKVNISPIKYPKKDFSDLSDLRPQWKETQANTVDADEKFKTSPELPKVKRKSSDTAEPPAKHRKTDIKPASEIPTKTREELKDGRKVVRLNSQEKSEKRKVSLKETKLSNFQFASTSRNRPATPDNDLEVNTSVKSLQEGDRESEVKGQDILGLNVDDNLSDGDDRNNNTEFKLFIGNKEKLLSIQSWINDLEDGAASDSSSQDCQVMILISDCFVTSVLLVELRYYTCLVLLGFFQGQYL